MRLSSLGDVILTTPVLRNLKEAWPEARVEVLVKAAYAEVFRDNPAVDEVLVFEARGFWGWAGEIRRRGYDVYVDLHDTPRSRLWGWLSGARRKARYEKQAWARRRLVRTKRVPAGLKSRVVDRYLAALPGLGVEARHRRTELFTEGEVLPDAALGQEPKGVDRPGADVDLWGPGPFIGLAPGAQHATKRWPPERFAEAADRLAAGPLAGATVLLLGSRQDEDAAADVLRHLRAPAVSLVGRTSLGQLLAALRRCALVLTNDSGVMHAAGALKVPTAAVFGSTVEAFGFFPEPDCSAVAQVEGLYCRPCGLHGRSRCPEGHFRCMREVTAERVAAAAEGLLRKVPR